MDFKKSSWAIGKLLSCAAVTLLASSCACFQEKECAKDDEYTLVWADEFNYTGAPNPKYWGYEEGYVRNKEAQYYTLNRLKNVRVENGNLVIEAHKEDIPIEQLHTEGSNPKMNHNKDFKVAKFTSGSINTKNKVDFKYGKLEVRAKMPQGDGVWPAIWTLGINKRWPANGEIDIMEYFYTSNSDKTSCNVHFARNGKHTRMRHFTKQNRLAKIDKDEFQVYSMIWTPEKVEFYCDGKFIADFDTKHTIEKGFHPLQQPHFLLLNFAIGGFPNKIVDDTIYPQQYLVDYVRLYRKNNADFAFEIK